MNEGKSTPINIRITRRISLRHSRVAEKMLDDVKQDRWRRRCSHFASPRLSASISSRSTRHSRLATAIDANGCDDRTWWPRSTPACSSTRQISGSTPNSHNQYYVGVQYPEKISFHWKHSKNIPITSPAQNNRFHWETSPHSTRTNVPSEVIHTDLQPTMDLIDGSLMDETWGTWPPMSLPRLPNMEKFGRTAAGRRSIPISRIQTPMEGQAASC